MASCFAEYLLMPKLAIERAVAVRCVSLERATALQVFALANSFGVGYRSLLHHLVRLDLISAGAATRLRKATPASIRRGLGIETSDAELFLFSKHWGRRPLDLHIGDLVLVSVPVEQSAFVRLVRAHTYGWLYKAIVAGRGEFAALDGNLSWTIRVSRRVPGGGFEGRSLYRHEEEPADA